MSKQGALSAEDMAKFIADLAKEAGVAKEKMEELAEALGILENLPPILKGDWGQVMDEDLHGFLEKWKKGSDNLIKLFDAVSDTFNMFYDNKLDNLEYYYQKEEELIDKNHKKEMDSLNNRSKQIQENRSAGLLSAETAAAQQSLLDAQKEQKEKRYQEEKEKREKAYQKKKNELEVKAAKWQKASDLMTAANAMSIAIINALALPTITQKIAAMALITSIGAAQMHAIATRPLPRYAKGTGYHPGGPAIVGDGGKHEVIVSPRTSTVMDLPRGSMVFPDIDTFLLSRLATSQVFDSGQGTISLLDPELRSLTADGNRELVKVNRNLMTMRANDKYFIQESIRRNVASKYK